MSYAESGEPTGQTGRRGPCDGGPPGRCYTGVWADRDFEVAVWLSIQAARRWAAEGAAVRPGCAKELLWLQTAAVLLLCEGIKLNHKRTYLAYR